MIDSIAWLKGDVVQFDGSEVIYPDGRQLALRAVQAMHRRIKRFVTPRKCPHCDCPIDFENPRSTPQLRRYFGMIRAFHTHWPEAHPEQFDDCDNFRYWLQMKTSPQYRYEKARIPLNGVPENTALLMVRAGMMANEGFAYPKVYNGCVVIWKPKSIAYEKMPHADFCKLSDEIAVTFEAETGLNAKDVFKETENAA
jgi:hypothetical protein